MSGCLRLGGKGGEGAFGGVVHLLAGGAAHPIRHLVEGFGLAGDGHHGGHVVRQGTVEAHVGAALALGSGVAQQAQGQLRLARAGRAHHPHDA